MKPRILFLVPSYACDPDSGGGQRSLLLYNVLCESFIVDTIIIDQWGAQGNEVRFQNGGGARYHRVTRPGKRGLARLVHMINPDRADTLSTLLHGRKILYEVSGTPVDFTGYDAIVSRYLRTAARVGALKKGVQVPVLIDVDDRDDQVLDARLVETKNPIIRSLLRRHRDDMAVLFRELIAQAEHLWTVTEEDRKAIDHPSISLLPNIPYDIPAEVLPMPETGETILFIGAGGHRPNVQGVQRFVQQAWPLIRRARPDATMRIVGSGDWENHADRLSAPGITIVGHVDDISEEYARANIAICPVFEGGGSKIKVLEAFAYNRPIVSAVHSARGFVSELTEGAILCASNEAELAKHCITLLANPTEARARASRGREVVLEKYSQAHFRAEVVERCMKIINADTKQTATA